MAPLGAWGPATWTFFHTMAEQVREEVFPTVRLQLIHMIVQVCTFLPCPECQVHAKRFWSNVNYSRIMTKDDLRNILFVFHNSVNKRKRKPAFKHAELEARYGQKNLVVVFNEFVRHYNTNGNMQLIADSFHRTRLLATLKAYMMRNMGVFRMKVMEAYNAAESAEGSEIKEKGTKVTFSDAVKSSKTRAPAAPASVPAPSLPLKKGMKQPLQQQQRATQIPLPVPEPDEEDEPEPLSPTYEEELDGENIGEDVKEDLDEDEDNVPIEPAQIEELDDDEEDV